MTMKKNDSIDDWFRYDEHYYTCCRWCKRSFGSSLSYSIKRYHLRQCHPEKIGYKKP